MKFWITEHQPLLQDNRDHQTTSKQCREKQTSPTREPFEAPPCASLPIFSVLSFSLIEFPKKKKRKKTFLQPISSLLPIRNSEKVILTSAIRSNEKAPITGLESEREIIYQRLRPRRWVPVDSWICESQAVYLYCWFLMIHDAHLPLSTKDMESMWICLASSLLIAFPLT